MQTRCFAARSPLCRHVQRSRALRALFFCSVLALPACAETIRLDPRTAGMLEFIGSLEAPGGYDVWSHYAAAPPPKPLTTMTVNEVLAWQESIDARSRSEAAGRFQIMEDTLRDYLVPTMGLSGEELFDEAMQNAMAAQLMKRRGWNPDSRAHVAMGNALALMSDPTINDWLKDAIATLAKRDPEEAFRDADLLYTLMKDRWEKHTEKHSAKQQTEGTPK